MRRRLFLARAGLAALAIGLFGRKAACRHEDRETHVMRDAMGEVCGYYDYCQACEHVWNVETLN